MECTFAEAAAVAPGGAAVNFEVVFQGQSLECSIARDVLEQYFLATLNYCMPMLRGVRVSRRW